MKIADLEAQATELQKSMNGGAATEEKTEEVTPLGLANKALSMLQAILPERLSKAFGSPMPMAPGAGDDDDDEEDEAKKLLAAKMGAKKSGEIKQPHGDQNSLNSGEMSSSKRIPKKFNYDEKMNDTGIDYPENAEVNDNEEKKKVRKSFTEVSNDPDLSEDEKVFVINDMLEKGFDEIHQLRIETARAQKSLDTIAFASSVMLQGLQKSYQMQANTGRGRLSVLSAVDKPSIVAKAVNGEKGGDGTMSKMDFSRALLKAQKSQKLTFGDVALAETCMNENLPIPENIIAAVQSE